MTKKPGRPSEPPLNFDVAAGMTLRLAVGHFISDTIEGRKLLISFMQAYSYHGMTVEGSVILTHDLWPRIEAQLQAGTAAASGRRSQALEREFIPGAVFYQTTPDLELNTVGTPDGLLFFDVRLTRVKPEQEQFGGKRRGRPPAKAEQIAASMMAQIAAGERTLSDFDAMKADAMAAMFGASRNTCKAALLAVKKSGFNS